jgi:putative sigma-54 modulation protein
MGNVKVESVHFTADQKLVDFINERVNKLNTFFDHIVSTDVILKVDKKESPQNKVVEIKMLVPGKDLFAKKQADSFEEATDEVVEALRRQIKKYKEKTQEP